MESDIVDEHQNNDKDWEIVYTTIFLIGVFVFFWLLVAVFNDDIKAIDVQEVVED